MFIFIFFFKQKTAYEMRISDWSSDVCSSDLKDDQVHVRVASSFISPEQALLNLRTEIGNDSFDTTQAKAKAAWEKELSRIRVTDPDAEKVRTFYSALYWMLQFPRIFYEKDANGKIVHYSPYDGKVHDG